MGKPLLNLSFFWHMHQPDYRGLDGVMKMPWVFLHAIKDYYEMPWLLSEYLGLKATFNLSASLIEQIKLYDKPIENDYFLSLWIQHPSMLDANERGWLIKLIGAMQFETMVRPIGRYAELYYKNNLSDDEFIDLEVVFILAWCGNYLRLHNTYVKMLFEKKQGYTQSDKTILLESLAEFIKGILPFYGELQKQGVISISTTPYFHPILPLLLDMQNASLANSATALPSGAFSLQEDANEQVERSIVLYKDTFGCNPNGFWPAEGAVDEKSVLIYKKHNIKWIATDEAILYKSLNRYDPSAHYQPYIFNDVAIAFRDHGLSDQIGFEYRHKDANEASGQFMNALEQIAQSEVNPTVCVIVDGENAWEFYENNGLNFFKSLYGSLSSSSWCSTLTMDEVASLKTAGHLDALAPGSWIHGTFDTWAGHPEKNRAWEFIFGAYRDMKEHSENISDEVMKEIRYHLLASECSDWFWWYGEDHFTGFSIEFDKLFRDHLIRIYQLLDIAIPKELFEPIISSIKPKPFWIKPINAISPTLSGGKTLFFEWMGCGVIDERHAFSTMDRLRGPVDIMYYGLDKNRIYFALEGSFSKFKEPQIKVKIAECKETVIVEPIILNRRVEFSLSRDSLDGLKSIHLRIFLLNEAKTVQSLPGFGVLELNLDDYFTTNWFI
ncbi:glycoside hydrolase family 57 protein [Sulfurimonas sp.]|uniref:glycoside hydrolase family 57 protein n=1 Tax=Sulfurimonas sp. TaxID=2022749 RepID=UPI0025F26764|nr:glycoside hydrolase family 57 protein [Sulfurimonas sp.]MDD5157030.1 glycoside hydrolase family 57 protein [Sulfurimonas sp.]